MKIEKRVVVCMCIAFVSAFFLTGWLLAQRGLLVDAKAQETQENLAQEVLRFHVLANSDSEEDQEMKMQVKEAVLSYLEESIAIFEYYARPTKVTHLIISKRCRGK